MAYISNMIQIQNHSPVTTTSVRKGMVWIVIPQDFELFKVLSMHKNVNLNQFSIIHNQKKIIGKDDPSNGYGKGKRKYRLVLCREPCLHRAITFFVSNRFCLLLLISVFPTGKMLQPMLPDYSAVLRHFPRLSRTRHDLRHARTRFRYDQQRWINLQAYYTT